MWWLSCIYQDLTEVSEETKRDLSMVTLVAKLRSLHLFRLMLSAMGNSHCIDKTSDGRRENGDSYLFHQKVYPECCIIIRF